MAIHSSTRSAWLRRTSVMAAIAATVTVAGASVVGAVPATAVGSSVRLAAPAAGLASSRTTLSTSRNPAYTSQAGGITARVKGISALGTPTGSVDIYLDGQLWTSSALDATGRARLSFADVGVGDHVVAATYGGDAAYAGSSSGDLLQTVLATAPTTSLVYSPSSVAPGGTSRLTLAATNKTTIRMPNLAMGVLLPAGATIVKSPPGAGCRRALANLYYCLTSAAPGATRQILVDVTAPAMATTLVASGYSRNLDTMEETSTAAVLAVG